MPRKKKSKVYFGKDVQDAIIRYNLYSDHFAIIAPTFMNLWVSSSKIFRLKCMKIHSCYTTGTEN